MNEDAGDELADRVSSIEQQQQRADGRALGSLDHDLSDLQQQRRQDVRLLQSLRDTQIEHGERLERLEARVGGLESRVVGLESATSAGFAAVGSRLDVIVELLRQDRD